MAYRTRPVFVFYTLVAISMLFIIPFSQNLSENLSNVGIPNGTANITLANLSIPGVISAHAPLLFMVGLQNVGGFVASNITINVQIRGVASFNDTFYANPLSPLENESLIISKANRTLQSGNYTIKVNASYLFNGSVHYSNSLSGNYSVVSAQPWPQNTTFIAQTSNFSITYAPLYTALFLGNETISQLGIKNMGVLPEFVNISVGGNYSKLMTLSTDSVYMQPNQTLEIQFVLKSMSIPTDIAVYNIPITFNITNPEGGKSNVTEHIILSVSNRTQNEPRVLNQVNLIDYNNTITGIVEIVSPSNMSLQNATLTTLLPELVTSNTSQITTYGLQAAVSKVNDKYEINWIVPYLPAGQITYGYYTIKNAQSEQFPLHIQNILSVPSQLKSTNILKILNLSIPTFYTNSTRKISVDVLYTGTTAQPVYFYLTAPPGITVYNSSQTFNATPNELLSKKFEVQTNKNSGTVILTLYITTQSANITYSLPVVVLQNQSGATSGNAATTIKTGGSVGIGSIAINQKELETYLAIAGGIIFVVLLAYGMLLIINRPRYNRDRAKKLLTIKDQIRRQSDGIG